MVQQPGFTIRQRDIRHLDFILSLIYTDKKRTPTNLMLTVTLVGVLFLPLFLPTPHNYHITVYALDIPDLDVNSSASPAMASFYILRHTLAKAVLTALTNAR